MNFMKSRLIKPQVRSYRNSPPTMVNTTLSAFSVYETGILNNRAASTYTVKM